MALELFANDAATTVASGGTDAPAGGTGESWTVTSSASFPAASNSASPPTQFHVADPAASSEVIAVTNVASTTWTVTRGAESTTPVTHSPGFTVVQVVTAGDYTGMFPLIPTSVQSGTITASPGQMVLMSTASTAGVINFPHAPSGIATIGAKLVTYGTANTVTIKATGGDTFSSGGSTATLAVLSEGGIWQYDAGLTEWVKQSNDLPLAQLDSRYVSQSLTQTASTLPVFSITPNQTATPSPFTCAVTTGTFGTSPAVTESIYNNGYNVPGTPGYNSSDYSGYWSVLPNCGDSVSVQIQWNITFPDGSTFQPIKLFALRDGSKALKWLFDISGTGGQFVISAGGVTSFSVAGGSVNVNTLPFFCYTNFRHLGSALGFFSNAAVGQQANAGLTAGFTAGSSTAVTVDATFTGNSGSRAYTIGDIVHALKTYGLIA